MKLSRVVVFDERSIDLYLVIISVVRTKDLHSKILLSIIFDSPHIGGAAMDGPITGFI